MKSVSCDETLLLRFLEDDLEPALRHEVSQHLKRCEGCQALTAEHQKLTGKVSALSEGLLLLMLPEQVLQAEEELRKKRGQKRKTIIGSAGLVPFLSGQETTPTQDPSTVGSLTQTKAATFVSEKVAVWFGFLVLLGVLAGYRAYVEKDPAPPVSLPKDQPSLQEATAVHRATSAAPSSLHAAQEASSSSRAGKKEKLPSAAKPKATQPKEALPQRKASALDETSRDLIRRTIKRAHNGFQYCYQSALGAKPDLQGRVEVTFVISATGQVTSAQTTKGIEREVDACVAQKMSQLHFSLPPSTGQIEVSYPFVFRSRGEALP